MESGMLDGKNGCFEGIIESKSPIFEGKSPAVACSQMIEGVGENEFSVVNSLTPTSDNKISADDNEKTIVDIKVNSNMLKSNMQTDNSTSYNALGIDECTLYSRLEIKFKAWEEFVSSRQDSRP